MSVEIRVPQLPESVADARLVGLAQAGRRGVSRDENLADLETDKVMLEVPAPVSGVLREIKVQAGTTVKSGELLAVIEEGAAATARCRGRVGRRRRRRRHRQPAAAGAGNGGGGRRLRRAAAPPRGA